MPFKIFTTPWSEKKNEEEKKEEGKVDEKKAEEVKAEAPKIGAMPNGDYMVHVSSSINNPVGAYTAGKKFYPER